MKVCNVIIAGYPKSGNTWLTRLVAELLDAPVAGFWNENEEDRYIPEIAIEGESRASFFSVFKSHHEYNALIQSISEGDRIIYIVRDPRDVALSCARFFKPDRIGLLKKIRNPHNVLRKCYLKFLYDRLHSYDYRLLHSVNAVCYGNENIHPWCAVSWSNHVAPFLRVKDRILVIRYEDLLEDTRCQAKRILKFLNNELSEDQIGKICKNQSFEQKKSFFLNTGQFEKADFMKLGEKNQWISKLSKDQNRQILDNLQELIVELGYVEG